MSCESFVAVEFGSGPLAADGFELEPCLKGREAALGARYDLRSRFGGSTMSGFHFICFDDLGVLFTVFVAVLVLLLLSDSV